MCNSAAGTSGLACARWAFGYGVEPVVFERMDGLGGLWLYKDKVVNDGKKQYADDPMPIDLIFKLAWIYGA